MTRYGMPLGGYHQRREAEWVGALVLLGVAIALLLPGATFSRPTFDAFGAIAPEGTWGATLLGVALVRMIGLWVNGSKRHSPSIRLVTAAVGACVWTGLAWLLAHDGYPGWNTGVGAYGVLALVDSYCAFRAIWTRAPTTPARRSSGERRVVDLLSSFLALPADALKAIGTVAVGAVLGLATYVVSRIKEARRPPEQAFGMPRIALDPVDRDLGFTLVRTGTDLTRALHDHGEILRATLVPRSTPSAPAAPPTRSTRTRRPQP